MLEDELRTLIEQNPRVASRLAMWGRRLIGDTMLVARSAAFAELIGAHTRRMDALGLTA